MNKKVQLSGQTSGGFDTSVAALLTYVKGGVWRVTANATTIVLTNDGVTTATITTTDKNYGEIKALVEANAGWQMKLVGTRSDGAMSPSGTNNYNTFGITTGTNAGIALTHDATNSLKVGIAVGREGDTSLPAQIRDSGSNISRNAEPLDPQNDYAAAVGGYINEVSAVATYGGGALAWYVSICTQDADGAYIINGKAAGATTVSAVLNEADFGPGGLELKSSERAVVEIRNTTTAMSAGTLAVVNGGYGEVS
jgi:hypothetical protein